MERNFEGLCIFMIVIAGLLMGVQLPKITKTHGNIPRRRVGGVRSASDGILNIIRSAGTVSRLVILNPTLGRKKTTNSELIRIERIM